MAKVSLLIKLFKNLLFMPGIPQGTCVNPSLTYPLVLKRGWWWERHSPFRTPNGIICITGHHITCDLGLDIVIKPHTTTIIFSLYWKSRQIKAASTWGCRTCSLLIFMHKLMDKMSGIWPHLGKHHAIHLCDILAWKKWIKLYLSIWNDYKHVNEHVF